MRSIILEQPEHIIHSIDINRNVAVHEDVDSIILAGMGGSGYPGDLLNTLSVSKVPLYVHRSYDLPVSYLKHMGLTKPLVVISSHSGNTEEALSAYEDARKNNLPILASTSGGTLEAWCARDHVPQCVIDYPNLQPRHTLFAAFSGIVTALAGSSLVENMTDDLTKTAQFLRATIPNQEARASELAKKLHRAIPVYTASDRFGFAAESFKIQTNENVKAPAFWNVFPELNHNELVGFSKLMKDHTNAPGIFHVVMIRDEDDHPRIKARMDVTQKLYETWGIGVSTFDTEGATLMEKLFSSVTFGLWTTYFLARLYNIDPIPVEGVEDFKKQLKQVAG